jgi:transcriptional regulator with XRE-family HTH domain
MAASFHFGSMLRKIIQEHKYTRVQITNGMGVTAPILYKYEARFSLQLYIILRLCHAMKYNLLMDIATTLPPEYDYDQVAKTKHQERLTTLEEENKKLKWENDLLKEMMVKRG